MAYKILSAIFTKPIVEDILDYIMRTDYKKEYSILLDDIIQVNILSYTLIHEYCVDEIDYNQIRWWGEWYTIKPDNELIEIYEKIKNLKIHRCGLRGIRVIYDMLENGRCFCIDKKISIHSIINNLYFVP